MGSNGLTEQEKKLVMAKMTVVLPIFKTHKYSFGSRLYLQVKGGPIGLRSTCCVARLVMLWWDDMLVEAVEKLGLRLISGARYMDDIRIWMHAIRLGWRIVDESMEFISRWRKEEIQAEMPSLQKMTEILRDIMNGICGLMETEDMFNGVLRAFTWRSG